MLQTNCIYFKPKSYQCLLIYLNICEFSLPCTPDGYEKQDAHLLAEQYSSDFIKLVIIDNCIVGNLPANHLQYHSMFSRPSSLKGLLHSCV